MQAANSAMKLLPPSSTSPFLLPLLGCFPVAIPHLGSLGRQLEKKDKGLLWLLTDRELCWISSPEGKG